MSVTFTATGAVDSAGSSTSYEPATRLVLRSGMSAAPETGAQQMGQDLLVVAKEEEAAALVLVRPFGPIDLRIGRSIRAEALDQLGREGADLAQRPLADPGQHGASLG